MSAATAGAVGGLVATAAMSAVMLIAQRLGLLGEMPPERIAGAVLVASGRESWRERERDALAVLVEDKAPVTAPRPVGGGSLSRNGSGRLEAKPGKGSRSRGWDASDEGSLVRGFAVLVQPDAVLHQCHVPVILDVPLGRLAADLRQLRRGGFDLGRLVRVSSAQWE